MKIRILVPIAIVLAVIGGWSYILLVPMPQLPIGIANGSYANKCCGTIQLKNGEMSVGGQLVSYVVERDKMGPYVLPSAYVGVSDGKTLEVDRRKYVLKIRLDDSVQPTQFQLMTDEAIYSFKRMIATPPKPQPKP